MITPFLKFIKRQLPLIETLSSFRRSDLRDDLVAGLTTAVMLVPQGMAYAMLAGLPPIIGLYASTIPLLFYALFGSSRQLAVGPVAMVSLLVATGVGAVAKQGTEQYIAIAILLAAMVGLIQLLMGIFRLGFLVNLLSHPVISGFTSAAALIIGFSQLKHLFGLEIPRSHHVHKILIGAARQINEVQLITLLIGALSVILLIALKRWKPIFPGALFVVVLGTIVVGLFRLDLLGVAIVGTVPQGLPTPGLPTFDLANVKELLPIALTIALVGFMESISVAKAFARKGHYDIDANKELVGLGLANIGGSLFSAYPVTGGFSRTAVNAQAGARSGLAAIITAGIIALTLLFLTPWFYFLPKAVLAAIIMVAVFGLVDLKEIVHLYRIKRSDLALLLITFGGTLVLGIEQGILIGVGSSLLAVILRTTRPHTAVLGQLPGTHAFRNIERFPEAATEPGVIAVRIDAQFYFGNVNFLRETLRRLEQECDQPLKAIVINASSINQIDSSADAALHEIVDDLSSRGIALFLAEVRGPVRDVMGRSGFEAKVGSERFFLTMRRAVQAAVAMVSKEKSIIASRQAKISPLGQPNGARTKESSSGLEKVDQAPYIDIAVSGRSQVGR